MEEPSVEYDRGFIDGEREGKRRLQERIIELEAELEKPPKDILICKCGWWGSMEGQDALGTECGCCPSCGNEGLVWLSNLQERIKELERVLYNIAYKMAGSSKSKKMAEQALEGK